MSSSSAATSNLRSPLRLCPGISGLKGSQCNAQCGPRLSQLWEARRSQTLRPATGWAGLADWRQEQAGGGVVRGQPWNAQM
ncbi:hypothetical protein XELAEV_18002024mg [Xenopus laevis]|uniref:Uncharacterized protein n=1 Tax=Xenopus laevis TaxID=8355 RepID=A0A974BNX9_XENLA|nr:hypothetical protein XELAEV_18002024mg [Xenopus laevis]